MKKIKNPAFKEIKISSHKFICEGIETVLDVINAEDEEQARMLFHTKYPALKKDTVKITKKES